MSRGVSQLKFVLLPSQCTANNLSGISDNAYNITAPTTFTSNLSSQSFFVIYCSGPQNRTHFNRIATFILSRGLPRGRITFKDARPLIITSRRLSGHSLASRDVGFVPRHQSTPFLQLIVMLSVICCIALPDRRLFGWLSINYTKRPFWKKQNQKLRLRTGRVA